MKYMPHWMLGPDGWTMPVCQIDLRPGGREITPPDTYERRAPTDDQEPER